MRTYEAPVLIKREALSDITAGGNKISPFFDNNYD